MDFPDNKYVKQLNKVIRMEKATFGSFLSSDDESDSNGDQDNEIYYASSNYVVSYGPKFCKASSNEPESGQEKNNKHKRDLKNNVQNETSAVWSISSESKSSEDESNDRIDDSDLRQENPEDYEASLSEPDSEEDALSQERLEFQSIANRRKRYFSKQNSEREQQNQGQSAPIPQKQMHQMYGKGFSMMRKMGYEGGGLGRAGTGLTAPIQIKVRKKNKGLQNHGEKVVDEQHPSHDDDCDDDYYDNNNNNKTESNRMSRNYPENSLPGVQRFLWKKGSIREIRNEHSKSDGSLSIPHTYVRHEEVVNILSKMRSRNTSNALFEHILGKNSCCVNEFMARKNLEGHSSKNTCIPEETSDGNFSDESEADIIEDPRYIDPRTARMQRLRLKQLQETGQPYSSPKLKTEKIKIIDMTGPERKTIESLKESTVFSSNIEAKYLNIKSNKIDCQGYILDKTHVDKIVEERIHEKNQSSLALLRDNLKMYVYILEQDTISQIREKQFEEARYREFFSKESLNSQLERAISSDIERTREILREIKEYNDSDKVKFIHSMWKKHTDLMEADNFTADTLFKEVHEQSVREKIFLNQIEVARKYSNSNSVLAVKKADVKMETDSSSGQSISHVNKVSFKDNLHKTENEGAVKMELGEDSNCRKDHESFSEVPCGSYSTLEQHAPQHHYKELCDVFNGILKRDRELYLKLNLPQLGALFALEFFNCFRTEFQEDYCGTLALSLMLAEFRNRCLPHIFNEAKEQKYKSRLQKLQDDFEKLIRSNTMKGLQIAIQKVTINPSQQDLSLIMYIFDWTTVIPSHCIAELFVIYFFPKWEKVLQSWLSSLSVDLEEVYIWYNGWKSIFPESILKHPSIQDCLIKGLHVINNSLNRFRAHACVPVIPSTQSITVRSLMPLLNTIADPKDPLSNPSDFTETGNQEGSFTIQENLDACSDDMSYSADNEINPPVLEPDYPAPISPPPPPALPKNSKSPDFVLKPAKCASLESRLLSASRVVEVLEAVAEEKNIIMIPKSGRMHNGKQVYGFGARTIYIDSEDIYIWIPRSSEWLSVSIGSLLQNSSSV